MNNSSIYQQEVICALATAQGVGAIAVIRVSGQGAIEAVNRIFRGKNLVAADSHTVHFGSIHDNGKIVDEVLATVFKSPRSFTKENSVEISCHGSDYIIRQIIKLLIQQGARVAKPGEFTQRAFMNGQFDLVQAEAVADLIAADSEASHKTALNQLRGGFSKKLASLRTELIHFASLIELELDFGEEDVEFAGREDLRRLIESLLGTISPLVESFDYGNAIKEGIPVAIIGSPNVGKSTLLNALLNEEKAIVTSIAGTTRDVIEDTMVIGGLKFRFIDTAGIRETTDLVESIGIERSRGAMAKADIVIFLFDSEETLEDLDALEKELAGDKKVIWVRNKVDLVHLTAQHLTPRPPLLSGEGEEEAQFPSPPSRGVRGEVLRGEVEGDEDFKSLIFKVPPPILENARILRQSETDAEAFLWKILRNRQFNDLKFRRQHPLEEGFVLDFFCAEFRLGLELDGGVHLEREQALYDVERERRIKELYGIDILRFSNGEVLGSVVHVLERIGAFVLGKRYSKTSPQAEHLTPQPPLIQGEGEESDYLPSPTRRGAGGEVETEAPPRGEVQSPSPLRRGVRGEVNSDVFHISAQSQQGLETLKSHLVDLVKNQAATDTVVTNLRHYEHLLKTREALNDVITGLDTGITGDFLAQDIRLSLHHLGEITGTIVTDDLLENIFRKFCIGK